MAIGLRKPKSNYSNLSGGVVDDQKIFASSESLKTLLTQYTMKNKTGKIIGFILGLTGFLFMFKIFILDHTTPDDELAPGMVVILAVLNGLLFSFFGNLVQNYLGPKENSQ
jgi:hypothetical protein